MLGELDTYSLIDFFPFSKEVYLRLFGLQNEAWWPAQFIFLFLALLVFAIAVAPASWVKKIPARWRSAVFGAFLAVSFTLVAVTFFLGRYADLNWAAPYFGWVFIAQAVLFALVGALGKLEVAGRADGARVHGREWIHLAMAIRRAGARHRPAFSGQPPHSDQRADQCDGHPNGLEVRRGEQVAAYEHPR